MSRMDESQELPAFAIGMRGYDRGQVDDYVDTLRGFLAEAQERVLAAEWALSQERARSAAEAVERAETTDHLVLVEPAAAPVNPAARALDGLSGRVADAVRASLVAAEEAASSLLEQAAAERDAAAEARRRADDEAAELVHQIDEQASEEAALVVAHAREQAGRIVADARAEQASILSTTEEHVTSLRQRADQEQARRDHAIRQMTDLRKALEQVAGSMATGPMTVAAVREAVEAAEPTDVAAGDPADAERTTMLRLP